MRFKTPSATSSSYETPEVGLIQVSQRPTAKPVYMSLYNSYDTDSSDIPNTQRCKYSPQKVSSDDMNDEGTTIEN